MYDVSNPHPGYGTDSNILNEFGHTAYPKWVDHPTEKKRVLVQDEAEEAELLGKKPTKVEAPKPQGWSK